jgi:hypothetical protein
VDVEHIQLCVNVVKAMDIVSSYSTTVPSVMARKCVWTADS